jgi:hypothetical protein
MRRFGTCCIAFVLCFIAPSANAKGTASEPVAIGTARAYNGFRTIYVTLLVAPESFDELKSRHSWSVILGDKKNRTESAPVTLKRYNPANRTLEIDVSPQTPGFVPASCVLIVDMKTTAVCEVPGQNVQTSAEPPASHKWVYRLTDYLWTIDGSYSPAIGSKAQYSLDSIGAVYFLRCRNNCDISNYRHYFGGEYTINMDQRNDVDPDSFTASFVYKYVRNKHLKMLLYPAGVEADRRDPVFDFISAGVATVPFRIYPRIASSEKLIANATLSFGLEGGDNIINAVTGDGSGGIVRGLAGIDAGAKLAPTDGIRVKQQRLLKDIKLISTYRVRIPAIAELYTVPINSDTNTYSLSTKTHHYVKSELDFDFNDWLSLTIRHEHGALPPAFKEIGQSVTVGLKVTLDSSKGGTWLGGFSAR